MGGGKVYVGENKTRIWNLMMALLVVAFIPSTNQLRPPVLSRCYDRNKNPQECNPEFENIAHKKRVVVTETCGVDGRDPFCKLVEENGVVSRVCDVCERTGRRSHPARYLTDINDIGNLTYWQSKTFQPGEDSDREVELTISFGKEYELSYLYMEFASPRPAAMVIYKSMNHGKTWVPYQHYAKNCRRRFNMAFRTEVNRTNEQEVLCSENFSEVYPYSRGIIVFNPRDGRPSDEDFDNSYILQEWVTATDVKIVLSGLNDIPRNPSAVARIASREGRSALPGGGRRRMTSSGAWGIPRMTRGGRAVATRASTTALYHAGTRVSGATEVVATNSGTTPTTYSFGSSSYYAINDISIGGICKCNGHAERCLMKKGKMVCDCKHKTTGPNCDMCKAFHMDRPPQRATKTDANECIACNCNMHAKRCRFNHDLFEKSGRISGGVCVKCRHNTDGRYCHFCKAGYYRNNKTKSISDKRTCKLCDCNRVGSLGKHCDRDTGQCVCKEHVTRRKCNFCAKGYKQTGSIVAPCARIPVASTPPKGNPSCPRRCSSARGVRVSLGKFCRMGYAVVVQVTGKLTLRRKTRFTLQLHKTYKRGVVRFRKKERVDVEVRDRIVHCLCPKLQVKKTYLLIGKYNRSGGEPRLAIDKGTIVMEWKNKYKRRLRSLQRRARRRKC
uniref:Netrin-1 n=1 Tax=Ciona savignyi TaxID=51511 RepID=Q95YK2_CIOSA|nr:netrin [Ciona savignyi]